MKITKKNSIPTSRNGNLWVPGPLDKSKRLRLRKKLNVNQILMKLKNRRKYISRFNRNVRLPKMKWSNRSAWLK